MNKIYKLLFLLSIVATIFTACSPESFALGGQDVKSTDLVEGIAYKIEHDATNPNIVYLTSLMGSKYTPLWNHPQGRSQEQKVTLKIPFAGTYKVQFGVETRGGVIYGDTVSFKVDAMYADFISDPLWASLTGGVGKEKVWIADNGKYGMAPGAMSYADPSTVLEFNKFTPNWEPTGNANGSTDTDMGWGSTMTFSLKGKAGLSTHKINEGGKDEIGTFSLNVDNHTLTTTDATILRPDNFIANAANWNKDLKVLTLTDNQLRIAIMRTNIEGSWWYIFNYVSKTYADSYVPTNQPDPTPNIGGDANTIMTTSNTKVWKISDQSPYNWSDLTGALLNSWSTPADYAATGWAPYDANIISGISFNFTSTGAGAGKYRITEGATEHEGTYEVNSENVITFSNALSFPLSGWVSFATTAEKGLKVIKTKADALGNINEMWLGNRSTEKKEYQVFHLVLSSGASTVDAAKELKKTLTNSTSLKYKISSTYPFCWARNAKEFDFTEMPTWTNWTGSQINMDNIAPVALTFSNDGTVSYIDNKGAAQNGTFSIISGDKADGENLIVFSGININFEMTGVSGGWVNCNLNTNIETDKAGVSTTNTKLPAANFWELYKWEYDATGKVSGIWFGKQSQVVTGGATGERIVYHFVVSQ